MSLKIQNPNIVIVDDEPLVTTTLSTLLQLEEGLEPATFNSPLNAIEYISKNPVDLVISDFLMPDMNGIEFLAQVKKLTPDTTMILLTGYADKESAIKAINEIGIYRYIEKPWDNQDLLICIKNGLERRHLTQSLQNKIQELSVEKNKVETYNEKLESLVKQRTLELEKINKKLSAIINHCADGIVTVSKTGLISQANPVMEKLSGISKEEILNNNFGSMFAGSQPLVHKQFNDTKDILLSEYKLINKNKEIPVEMSFAPILSEIESEVKEFVGVIRDVTTQHDLNRLRDDFIATLTHDLRTPLQAAIQTLSFFTDGTLGDLPERQNLLLNTMSQSFKDMLGLVNALLEVYRYESGKLSVCKDFFPTMSFLEQCIAEIESLAKTKNITIKIQCETDYKIYADKQELRRVLANFLGNAINYTPENGNIKVSVKNDLKQIILSVKDTGTGIPKEDVPCMFNRFSQGTSKKRSTGTGLGLYLSKQIIEAHGGNVWLESELGKGSEFFAAIPFIKKECNEFAKDSISSYT